MTRTEERLQDALRASASHVKDDNLRPLPSLESGTQTGARTGPRKSWRAWLVPAAAAASVALIIGLAAAVTGGSGPAGRQPSRTSQVVGLPTYFVQFTGGAFAATIQVRSTATGALVASVQAPRKPRGSYLLQDSVAASPDGRTFYVDYDARLGTKSGTIAQVWIYRFSLTASAAATPLTRIKGGEFPGLAWQDTMAVSPDGTRLALLADTIVHYNKFTPATRGLANKIVVIDLRTGERSEWQDGLYRPGRTFTIRDISWTADGRSIVFLALWCNFPAGANLCTGTMAGTNGYRDTQVRSLSASTGGGTLDHSTVLLTQSARYPVIADAIAGPDPAELTVLVLSGQPNSSGSWPEVAVDRVSAAGGSLLGVAYHAAAHGSEGQPGDIGISADPSGRYVLFSYPGKTGGYYGGAYYTGWIGQGRLHFLPVRQPYVGWAIRAW